MPSPSTPSLIWLLCAVTMLGPMSVDMYLPALPVMANALDATTSSIQLTITAFLLGFGLGPLVLGPLSDSVGRKPVMLGCIALFVVTSLLCALATSVEELIGYRVLQALGGGSATTISRAVAHDVYQGDMAARVLSTLMMVLSLALMAAPALGGQLLAFFGWPSIFMSLAGFGILCLLFVAFLLPETLPIGRRQPFRVPIVLKSYGRIFTSGKALGFITAGSFAGGAMFAYLAATPFIFIDYYGIDPAYFGALFAINMIGAILINDVNRRLVTRFGYRSLLNTSSIGLLVIASILFVVAVSDFGGLYGIAMAVFAIVGLSHVIGTNGLTGTLDLFRDGAGATSASFSACRFSAGVLTTLLLGILNDGTARPLGIVVLLCAVMAVWGTKRAIRTTQHKENTS